MTGHERVTGRELRPRALHALVLAPSADVRGSGSALETSCAGATETLRWTPDAAPAHHVLARLEAAVPADALAQSARLHPAPEPPAGGTP